MALDAADTAAAASTTTSTASTTASVRVDLLQLMPMVPPLDPTAPPERVVSLDGDERVSSLAWLPDTNSLALVDAGTLLSYGGNGAELGASPLELARAGGRELVSCTPFGAAEVAASSNDGTLNVLSLEDDTAAERLPLPAGLTARLVHALSSRRLLVVAEQSSAAGSAGPLSSVLIMSPPGEKAARPFESPWLGAAEVDSGSWRARVLASSIEGRVSGVATAADESLLFLSVGGSIGKADFDAEDEDSTAQLRFQQHCALEPNADAGALAVDVEGNVYVCAADGVHVFDEFGEELLTVRTAGRVRACCFGGSNLGTLFVSQPDGVWAVKASVEGVGVQSEVIRKRIEKQVRSRAPRFLSPFFSAFSCSFCFFVCFFSAIRKRTEKQVKSLTPFPPPHVYVTHTFCVHIYHRAAVLYLTTRWAPVIGFTSDGDREGGMRASTIHNRDSNGRHRRFLTRFA